MNNTGKIVQIIGPVIDAEFDHILEKFNQLLAESKTRKRKAAPLAPPPEYEVLLDRFNRLKGYQ